MLYKYGMRHQRGFGPGCQPMNGFVRHENGDGRYYDYLFYNRMLSEKEAYTYDLDFIDTEAEGEGEE